MKKNIEIDRLDKKVLDALEKFGTMDLTSLMIKADTKEYSGTLLKRLRRLREYGLIEFDDIVAYHEQYKISIKNGMRL
jgi:DNA-binding Lrp family transcriptional regulator